MVSWPWELMLMHLSSCWKLVVSVQGVYVGQAEQQPRGTAAAEYRMPLCINSHAACSPGCTRCRHLSAAVDWCAKLRHCPWAVAGPAMNHLGRLS